MFNGFVKKKKKKKTKKQQMLQMFPQGTPSNMVARIKAQ